MSLWFSASAVVPALRLEWRLSEATAGWLTIAVQLGFVAGTLLSAFLNLPDIFSTRRLFACAAFAGALSNGLFGLLAHDPTSAVVLRFLTGVCLAGAYPPGMKMMATWFRAGRGMALGVLVGALTLVSVAISVNASSANWRQMFCLSRCWRPSAVWCVLFVEDGPYVPERALMVSSCSRPGNRWLANHTSDTRGSCTRCGRIGHDPRQCDATWRAPGAGRGRSFVVIGCG
jgi:MFS family permease